MKLIEHPEPDFDLEAELPADLAALAEQLTADAGFLSDKFPARQPQAWKLIQETAIQETAPQPGIAASNSGMKYSARWWLRAAAIVFVLTGLGTVLNNRDEELGSCPVATEIVDEVAKNAMNPNIPLPIAKERPIAKELAVLSDPNAIAVDAASTAKFYCTAAVMPERTFHSFTSAQQEALLDLTPAARGASVDF